MAQLKFKEAGLVDIPDDRRPGMFNPWFQVDEDDIGQQPAMERIERLRCHLQVESPRLARPELPISSKSGTEKRNRACICRIRRILGERNYD